MTYKYLYQDKENRNHEGTIKARNRDDAFKRLRQKGIRPFRVIGDDPVNWQPWAVVAGYMVLLTIIGILAFMLADQRRRVTLSDEEARAFTQRSKEAVENAPEAYRYNVWKGVNARLEERGLLPLPPPEGMMNDLLQPPPGQE